MSDDILGMQESFTVEALKKKISELEKEVANLSQIIRDNDLDTDDVPEMSDEEFICVQQITRLKEQSNMVPFDQEQAKIFDTLVKDLNIIRGGNPKKKAKSKSKAKVKDLIKIARGEE